MQMNSEHASVSIRDDAQPQACNGNKEWKEEAVLASSNKLTSHTTRKQSESNGSLPRAWGAPARARASAAPTKHATEAQ